MSYATKRYVQTYEGNLTTSTTTVDVDLPSGFWYAAVVLNGAANNEDITVEVFPFCDKAQTVVGGIAYNMVEAEGTVGSTVTLASTGTTRGVQAVLAYGGGAAYNPTPVPSTYGMQALITNTSTASSSGAYKFHVLATEV